MQTTVCVNFAACTDLQKSMWICSASGIGGRQAGSHMHKLTSMHSQLLNTCTAQTSVLLLHAGQASDR
jgi:hypothetical protein